MAFSIGGSRQFHWNADLQGIDVYWHDHSGS